MYVRTYVKHVNTQIYYVRKAYQCIKLRHITNGGNGCKWVDAGWKLVRVGGSGLKMSGSELKMSGSGCASEWQWVVAQFYITRFKFAKLAITLKTTKLIETRLSFGTIFKQTDEKNKEHFIAFC